MIIFIGRRHWKPFERTSNHSNQMNGDISEEFLNLISILIHVDVLNAFNILDSKKPSCMKSEFLNRTGVQSIVLLS